MSTLQHLVHSPSTLLDAVSSFCPAHFPVLNLELATPFAARRLLQGFKCLWKVKGGKSPFSCAKTRNQVNNSCFNSRVREVVKTLSFMGSANKGGMGGGGGALSLIVSL